MQTELKEKWAYDLNEQFMEDKWPTVIFNLMIQQSMLYATHYIPTRFANIKKNLSTKCCIRHGIMRHTLLAGAVTLANNPMLSCKFEDGYTYNSVTSLSISSRTEFLNFGTIDWAG